MVGRVDSYPCYRTRGSANPFPHSHTYGNFWGVAGQPENGIGITGFARCRALRLVKDSYAGRYKAGRSVLSL
jgi:hypothetical protein